MADHFSAHDGSVGSSERTVSDIDAASSLPAAMNFLSTTHHFVSLKLTTRNFLFWRTQLVSFLPGQNLMGFVDGTLPCPPPTVTASSSSSSAGEAASLSLLPNPPYAVWVQQDQALMSMLISSLSEEVMHLAVGRRKSREVWESVERVLASSSRARALHLLGQLQALRQGDSSVADYIGRAQVLIDDHALASRPVCLDEQNLYVFKGLQPEFRSLTASLSVCGQTLCILVRLGLCILVLL